MFVFWVVSLLFITHLRAKLWAVDTTQQDTQYREITTVKSQWFMVVLWLDIHTGSVGVEYLSVLNLAIAML